MKLVVGAAVLASAGLVPALYASDATAKVGPQNPPIVRRVRDGKQVQIGEVFGRLKSSVDTHGVKHCIMDRAGTEVSIETSEGQEAGVQLMINADCEIRIVSMDAYADASSADGKVINSEVAGK